MKSVAIPTADEINEAHSLAKSSAQDAVQYAIQCGKLLDKTKAALGRGEFDGWIEQHCDFGRSMAYNYMKAAKSSNALDGFSSLRQALGYDKKPEPKAAKPAEPAFEAPAKPVEVAPAPEFDATGYEPEDDEAYQSNVENVMMADDKLGAMREELKRVHRELAAVKASRDHYQSEAGAAVRLVKARDRDIEKLRKQLQKAQTENEALRERVAIVEAA